MTIACLLLVFSSFAYGFDKVTAAKFDALFSQLTPEMISKKPCEVNAKQLFEMIKAKYV